MEVLRDDDADLSIVKGKRVAVIGYGNQGSAHACNLRDSGVDVVVGLRADSPSRTAASANGFTAKSVAECVGSADLIMILTPDEVQPALYATEIAPYLRPEQTIAFGHGFCIRFGFISPPGENDVIMIAPVGPGHLLRSRFMAGSGIPCLVAVHGGPNPDARALALSYAKAIGGGRAGILETTFKEECETDLFGEQTVIVGGVSALIEAGYETLTEAGYPEELAYFECAHQMKLLVDLIYARGIAGMRKAISNTAKYGDLTRGPRVIGPDVRARMREVLAEIQDGTFAQEWMDEARAGKPQLQELVETAEGKRIEATGHRLRPLAGVDDD